MSWISVRDGAMAVCETVTGLDSSNVTFEDWLPLDSGVKHAIVCEFEGMAPDVQRSSFGGGKWRNWEVSLHAYTAFTDITESQQAQDKFRDAIIAAFDHYPFLMGGTNFEALLALAKGIKMPLQFGSAKFLLDDFTLRVIDDVAGSELE